MEPNEASNGPTGRHIISLDNSKAGMQNVDKARTEQIIEEMSKGSSYYINEERKLNRRRAYVESLLKKDKQVFQTVVKSDPVQYRKLVKEIDELEASLERGRNLVIPDDLPERFARQPHRSEEEKEDFLVWTEQMLKQIKIYVHIDMDMFFAAVEEKKNPALKQVPFAVGSTAMLSTSNYIARQFGVRAGMAGFIGRKLCPALQIIDQDTDCYVAESAVFKKACAAYDPHYASAGLDEIMLELSAHLQREYPSLFEVPRGTDTLTVDSVVFPIFDKVEEVVQQIRSDIHRDTQLTASAGMAITSTLAKIGSNYNKPNGQKSLLKEVYTRGTVMDFFGRLKVKEVPGVGASSEFILNGLGIFTFHDFYEQRYRMGYLFTRKTFLNFLGSAIGICGMYAYEDEAEDDKPGEEEGGLYDTGRKTIGQERTFYKLKSRLELQEILLSNIEKVHERLTRKGLVCGQVVLKMKHTSFQLKQYSKDIEVFPPSNSNHTTDKPHYYEYEDKFYTDDLEQLKANGDVLLLPLVEHYAEYRLLGFTAGKLLRKEALLRVLESSKGAKKQQKTLQEFLGNRKRARTQGAAMEECICISSESDIEMEVHHHDPQEVVTVVSSDTLHESPTDRSNEVKDVQMKEERDVIFID